MFDTSLHTPKNSGRFATLMELYENNYVLVRLLAPRLREMGAGRYVSSAAGVPILEMSALHHERFTTTFNLSYRFAAGSGRSREPDLYIRLYHDARTAEVMSGLLPQRRCETRRVRDLIEGYRVNHFLHRWLSFCVRQGHVFDTTPAAGPVRERQRRPRQSNATV